MLRNTNETWGSISKTLHWLTVILILAAVTMGWVAELWPVSLEKINLFVFHKSIGMTVLLLAVVRLIWTLANPAPQAASGISETNNRIAHLGHWALYGILLAMPLSGWILNSAANFPFKWLGLIAVPNLVEPNEMLQARAEQTHYILFLILTVLVLGHALAAIWHHVAHRSDLLLRMLPMAPVEAQSSRRPAQLFTSLAILLLAGTAAIAVALSQTGEGSQLPDTSDSTLVAAATSGSEAPIVAANPGNGRTWSIDHDQSVLGFTGLYAGVAFDGDFAEFSATMVFDPDDLAASLFDATINTSSINTNSADRDSMMPEQDWFDFTMFPTATYRTTEITTTGPDQYVAKGALTIKGIEQPVDLPFRWVVGDDGTSTMTAETTINRIDFGLGARDWADDDTIGFEVVVKIDLVLTGNL